MKLLSSEHAFIASLATLAILIFLLFQQGYGHFGFDCVLGTSGCNPAASSQYYWDQVYRIIFPLLTLAGSMFLLYGFVRYILRALSHKSIEPSRLLLWMAIISLFPYVIAGSISLELIIAPEKWHYE